MTGTYINPRGIADKPMPKKGTDGREWTERDPSGRDTGDSGVCFPTLGAAQADVAGRSKSAA